MHAHSHVPAQPGMPPPPLHGRVGDQLRFGESSRLYVLGGPEDLMPEEGPSREDRMKQAALKVGVCLVFA